jgi:hypothetical protein
MVGSRGNAPAIIKISGKSLISKEKKMTKGHNLMDLAFFILKMYNKYRGHIVVRSF